MCIIIHVPSGHTVPRDALYSCYNNNSHGWGIMWATSGNIHTLKDVSSFELFYDSWLDIPRHVDRGIHFRFKTHGAVNKDNCHPFLPNENVAVMHNGLIKSATLHETMSDSHYFCTHELPFLIANWDNVIRDKHFVELMEEIIPMSLFLFIDKNGRAARTHENQWFEQNGIYFSNRRSLRDKQLLRSRVENSTETAHRHNFQ